MAGVPEGFIMPTMGTSLGGNVMKAVPSAEAVAGAMGTISAEIIRHREYNAEKTKLLGDLPGEMTDDIELVVIQTDKYTKVPLRASNLSDAKVRFTNELSIDQQVQLADLRERFRKNEHGSDTPIAMWDALNAGEQMQLVNMGVLYVEQLAGYKEHEYYKLGNGGADLVKRAQRHVGSKTPNKQEEFERQMASILAEKEVEKSAREDMEKKYLAMQEQIAELTKSQAKTRTPKTAGVQEG